MELNRLSTSISTIPKGRDLPVASPVRAVNAENKLNRLVFDGYHLHWQGDLSITFDAFSGMPDESARESDQSMGPIPQGKYAIDPREIEVTEVSDEMGNFRVSLSPYKLTIERMNEGFQLIRTGMFIHGGGNHTSPGGIQLTDGKQEEEFFRKLKALGEMIELEVAYQGERKLRFEEPKCPYNPEQIKEKLLVGNMNTPHIPYLHQELKEGVISREVEALQELLRHYGYKVNSPRGEFDSNMKKTVMRFQQKAGLTIDGKVGGETWGELGGKHEILSTGSQSQDNLYTLEIARIAQEEVYKALSWKSAHSEAEKYLRPLRKSMQELDQLPQNPVFFDWHAAFVLWCCRKAGFPVPDRPAGFWATMASADAWKFWAKQNAYWFEEGMETPQRGDILLLEWKDQGFTSDQIGIVSSYQKGNPVLHSYEGNIANQVRKLCRPLAQIQGFIRLH